MKIYRIILPVLLALFLVPAQLLADTVLLNGGQILEGEITGESKHIILLRLENGEILTIQKKEILEIEKEGSESIIPRMPRPRIEPWKAAALSTIPGYSGLYQTEYAKGGVFFTVTSLYFMNEVLTLESAQSVNFYQSNYFTDRFFGTDPGQFVAYGIFGRTAFNDYAMNHGLSWGEADSRYILLQKALYDRGEEEYRVGGESIPRQQYSDRKDRAWGYFLGFMMANAGLSYWLAEPPGDSAGSEDGTKTGSSSSNELRLFAYPHLKEKGATLGFQYRF